MKNARRFIADDSKVKVTIMFRGRELSHPELGEKLLVRFAHEMEDVAMQEKGPKLEGRNMTMMLVPKVEK